MNQMTDIQNLATRNEEKEQSEMQFAGYVEQEPKLTQSLHKWMKRLDVVCLGINIAAFVVAMYVSIVWKSVNPVLIPLAWFFFAASASLTMLFVGLHTILLRAYPPIFLPGKAQRFVSGIQATWKGLGLLVGGLLGIIFWSLIAFSTVTFNLDLLDPIIRTFGTMLGIGIAVKILHSIYKKVSNFR